MHFSKSSLAAAALAAAPLALAQTYTDCNPTEKSCPNDTGLEASSFSSNFAAGSSSNASWSAAAGTTLVYGSDGAEFIINEAGQAPTIQTDFYILFGKVEVVMQAAAGTGIISSIVLESDDLDEIDWEFLGGDTTEVETNYFGKGNTSTYDRAIYYPVSSPQTTFHTYTIDWTTSSLQFAIDGAVVRTLKYADANGGANYPQTPMRLKLGNWAAGAAGEPEGTVAWAGGSTDFSKAPFTMTVKSVSVTNYNPGSEYEWTDLTGSYQSIKVLSSDGSSSSVGTSGSSGSSSSSASSGSKSASSVTQAPTSMHSVKAVQQTAAAVSSTVSGASPSTTVATLVSTAKVSSATAKTGTITDTTLSSAKSFSTNASGSPISGSSSSSSSSGSSVSGTSSRNSSATSSSTMSVQSTNGAPSRGVATALTMLVGIAFAALMM